ncbi:mitochondrial fission ELM1 family protein [Hyphococcus flavus]|uniref:Mitochondrial fission ELM1 family protein n=1 Tax=Hyphococcus flavus TaxID=1866326 RepID=A0AAE9ZBS5_9PROT|nr:mitochondrial fission ELM1 family protein [Hyphococcus flavus]WDI30425.1 mitochondrial fission ELM1 family protein [Hyphococcus flavus]
MQSASIPPLGMIDRRGGLWVLTDGKIGDDVQCLAIANALNSNFEKRVVSPRMPWALMSPWGPVDPREAPMAASGPLAGAPPAVVIASGRRAVPHALSLKRASAGRTRIVIMKDPRFGRGAADVLWAPAHDRLTGPNVISTLTSPHGLSEKIMAARQPSSANIGALPKPLLGFVLGGPSGGARYGDKQALELAAHLNSAGNDFASIAITPSRRTPEKFLKALEERVAHERLYIWKGEGSNPYIDILGNADVLIVAADSHNMMSEALASRAGIYAWRPQGLSRKLTWFVDQLEARGDVRPFEDKTEPFDRTPVDATPEIVEAIKARLSL